MEDSKSVIEQAYTAFNQRDIDTAFALMTDDVTWPRASEGGRITGKQEIRAYWTRQWSEFDPQVHPLSLTAQDDARVHVRVHQVVRSLQGELLADGEVLHIFTMNNGLIVAMHLGDEASSAGGPSAAFTHRS